jgi:hypothetical protein
LLSLCSQQHDNKKDQEIVRYREQSRRQTDRARVEWDNQKMKRKRDLFSHAFKKPRFNLCKIVNISKCGGFRGVLGGFWVFWWVFCGCLVVLEGLGFLGGFKFSYLCFGGVRGYLEVWRGFRGVLSVFMGSFGGFRG